MPKDERSRNLLRLISLLMGFIIWAYLSGYKQTKVVSKAYTLPVYFENLPENTMLLENVFYEVNVQLRGSEQAIRRINPEDLYVSLNLEHRSFGVHSVPLTESMVHRPKEIQVVSITPNTLQFRIDRKIRKKVPVRAVIIGKPADGFEIYQANVTPPAVEVEGAATAFQQLTTVETEPIDVTDLNASFSTNTFVLLKSDYLKLLKEATVKVDVIIGEQTKTRIFRNRPIQLINQSRKTWVNPRRITVVVNGPLSWVDQLESRFIRVQVDCADLQPRKEDYILSPQVEYVGENAEQINRNVTFRTNPELVNLRVY